MNLNDFLILSVALIAGWRIAVAGSRSKEIWRATVTPLASIVGSGFLVAAPLLAVLVGGSFPAAMTAIVLLAYAIGGIIRFNIAHAEPLLLEPRKRNPRIHFLESLASVALGGAYIIGDEPVQRGSRGHTGRRRHREGNQPRSRHRPDWLRRGRMPGDRPRLVCKYL